MRSNGNRSRFEQRPRASLTALAFLSILFFAVGVNVTPASLTAMGRAFAVDPELLGSRLFLVEFGGFVVAVLVGGYFADRFGKRLLLQVGCLLSCAGFILVAACPVAGMAVLGIGVAGAGGGIVESLVSALLSDLHGERRQKYLNLSQVFYAVGAVLAPAAAGMAIHRGLGWRVSYGAAAALFAVALGWYAIERTPAPSREETSDSGATGELLRNPLLWATCVGMFLYVGAEAAACSWLPRYFAERWGFGDDSAGLMLSLFWGGMIPSRLLAGALYRRVRDINLIVGCLALGGVLHATLFSTNSSTAAICCAPLLGFTLGAVWPTILACAGRWFPGRTGTAFGMIVASGALGIVVVPPLVGWLAHAHSLGPVLTAVAALSIVNALLFRRLRLSEARRRTGDGGNPVPDASQ